MYRPKGWVLKQPVAQALEDIAKDEEGMARILTPFEKELFEAGADAILKALCTDENRIDYIDQHGVKPPKEVKGWLVFIPEE